MVYLEEGVGQHAHQLTSRKEHCRKQYHRHQHRWGIGLVTARIEGGEIGARRRHVFCWPDGRSFSASLSPTPGRTTTCTYVWRFTEIRKQIERDWCYALHTHCSGPNLHAAEVYDCSQRWKQMLWFCWLCCWLLSVVKSEVWSWSMSMKQHFIAKLQANYNITILSSYVSPV